MRMHQNETQTKIVIGVGGDGVINIWNSVSGSSNIAIKPL